MIRSYRVRYGSSANPSRRVISSGWKIWRRSPSSAAGSRNGFTRAAGLAPMTPWSTLQTVDGVLRAGGAGVMFANRIWDAPHPASLARSVAGMVHDAWTLEQALQNAREAGP